MTVPAKEFRRRARLSLAGEYGYAFLAIIIYSTLANVATAVVNFFGGIRTGFEIARRGADVIFNFSGNDFPVDPGTFFSTYVKVSPLSCVLVIANLILIAPLSVGVISYFIHLADRDNPNLSQLFGPYRFFGNAVILELLTGIFVFLWSLLFIIPGIIAALRYAMAPYILAEHPDMKPTQALNLSKQMMKGNCGRLFCLGLSFIGWYLLCILTLGVGLIFLQPYVSAANAHFFNEVSGKNYQKAQEAQIL